MATVLGNSIFGPVSGKIGNMVYSNWKGISYVKSLPSPSSKPKSQGQLTQSVKFKLIAQFLQPLKAFIHEGFKRSQKKYGFQCSHVLQL